MEQQVEIIASPAPHLEMETNIEIFNKLGKDSAMIDWIKYKSRLCV